MILRIILSLALLVPALPTEADCGGCPFTSIEEFREWLETCCGAGERVEAMCGLVCVEVREEDAGWCAESCTEEGPSECASGVLCCVAETNGPNQEFGPCNVDGEVVCLWCVCCPMGRPRSPEPQPAPMAQRAPSEEEKAKDDAGSRRTEPSVTSTALLTFATEFNFVPPDSRQAVLCVWRN